MFVFWNIAAVVFFCMLACAAMTDLNATTSFFGVYDAHGGKNCKFQVHVNAVHNHCLTKMCFSYFISNNARLIWAGF